MIKKFEEFIKSHLNEKKNNDSSEITKTDDGKKVSGLKEVIEIIGLGKIKAKLDSGNTAQCALIVQDFEEKDGKVKFEFNGEEKEYEVVDHKKIWHHGKSTERPVIKLDIKFHNTIYSNESVNLKISDLTGTKNYRCRMLLSKQFMSRANIVVDPSKTFELTDKDELKTKKKKK